MAEQAAVANAAPGETEALAQQLQQTLAPVNTNMSMTRVIPDGNSATVQKKPDDEDAGCRSKWS